MLDLSIETDVKALWTSIRESWKSMQPFRENRRKLIETYVGSEWGGAGEDQKGTIVNMLLQTVSTYMVGLTSNRPRVSITANTIEGIAFARTFELMVNNLIVEIRLQKTLQRVVLDAMFSIGIAKVFWADSIPIEVPNPDYPPEMPPLGASKNVLDEYRLQCQEMQQTIWVDPGKPFCEHVSLDDYVFDMNAATLEKARFHCHIYRSTMDAVARDSRFDQEKIERLGADKRRTVSDLFEGRVEQVADMQVGDDPDRTDIEPMVTLMDVWLPFENKWCVFSPTLAEPLYVGEWNGPESGPFHFLCFDAVPESGMPVPPAANLRKLHELLNHLMRHQARQAQRQKDVTTYQGDESDALQIKKAKDGEFVPVANPEAIQVLKYGGIDQMTGMFYQATEALFSRMAGNLDALAGLGPQSSTAKQDELIHTAVGKREAQMQGTLVTFVEELVSDLGWMLWVDAAYERELIRNEPGISIPMKARWTPDDREGDFLQYGFSVDPFSMAYQSPQSRLEGMKQALAMLMPVVQMTGGVVNGQRLVEMWARMANLPQLNEVIVFPGPAPVMPGQAGMGGPSGQPGMPGASEPREYVHRTVSTGGSPQGQRIQMAQQMGAASRGSSSQSQRT